MYRRISAKIPSTSMHSLETPTISLLRAGKTIGLSCLALKLRTRTTATTITRSRERATGSASVLAQVAALAAASLHLSYLPSSEQSSGRKDVPHPSRKTSSCKSTSISLTQPRPPPIVGVLRPSCLRGTQDSLNLPAQATSCSMCTQKRLRRAFRRSTKAWFIMRFLDNEMP